MGMITHDEVAGLNVTQTPGYEDVRRSVLESMRTTNTFAPSVSTPNKRVPKKAGAKGSVDKSAKKAGRPKKRRKMKQESEEDESESASELEDEEEISEEEQVMPAVTLSGRKVVRPTQFVPEPKNAQSGKRKGMGGRKSSKALDTQLCKRCGRGHSPNKNMIVFCDGCDKGWHQMCHDPMITDEIVKDESTEWYCSECLEKKQKKSALRAKSNTPIATPSHTPKPKPVWHDMSTAEKRQYLASMPHPHLVDLLMTAKYLHPDIPITPAPPTPIPNYEPRRFTNTHPQLPFPPSATHGLFSRSDANPSGQLNYIRKVPPGSTLPTSNAALSRQNSGTPKPQPRPVFQAQPNATMQQQPIQPQPVMGEQDADGEDESASPPPSPPYPKPGNGLMSRLKNDDEDLEWLVGGKEETAFSHLVFEGANANAAPH